MGGEYWTSCDGITSTAAANQSYCSRIKQDRRSESTNLGLIFTVVRDRLRPDSGRSGGGLRSQRGRGGGCGGQQPRQSWLSPKERTANGCSHRKWQNSRSIKAPHGLLRQPQQGLRFRPWARPPGGTAGLAAAQDSLAASASWRPPRHRGDPPTG
jgi:hypothetical protein